MFLHGKIRSKGIDASKSEIALIRQALNNPVRLMKEDEFASKFIEYFLMLTEAYFGAKNNSEPTIFSCMELMRYKFSHLALSEINEAARQYSSGNLGINIVAYNGIFTASMFGELLSAYCSRRDKIKMAIAEEQLKQQREIQHEEESKIKAIEFKKFAEDWFYEQVQNLTFKRWIELPYGICLALTDMDNIDIDIRNECFQIAKNEIENEKRLHLENGNVDSYRQLNRIIEGIESGNNTAKGELITRAKSIYPRLYVWKRLNNEI